MKIFTYNSLNLKKWSFNSTIDFLILCLNKGEEVNLYYFHLQGYFPFYHLKQMNLLFYFSSIIIILKKLRLKNNLSKSNQKLRDIITKKNDNRVIFKKGYEKVLLYSHKFNSCKK